MLIVQLLFTRQIFLSSFTRNHRSLCRSPSIHAHTTGRIYPHADHLSLVKKSQQHCVFLLSHSHSWCDMKFAVCISPIKCRATTIWYLSRGLKVSRGRVTWCGTHLNARAPISLSSSASRLTVRSALPSLFASTASFSSSLLLHSFRRCTLLLPKARGAGYAHVPGTIDEVIATDTSSSSRPIFLPPLLPLPRRSAVSNFRAPPQIRDSYVGSRWRILDRAHYWLRKFFKLEGISWWDNLIVIAMIRLIKK